MPEHDVAEPHAAPGTDGEIPQLTEAFHKARKHYALFSALLMAWELIGVEPQSELFDNVNVQLRTPQAAPYVFIVLMAYFGFRLTVEWHQSDPRRRAQRASIADVSSAHVIAVLAVGLYLVRRLLEFDVGRYLAIGIPDLVAAALLGALLTGGAGFAMSVTDGKANGIVTLIWTLVVLSMLVLMPTWPGRIALLVGAAAAGTALLRMYIRWTYPDGTTFEGRDLYEIFKRMVGRWASK